MFWWIMVASVSSSSGGRQAVASRSSTCFKAACIRTNFSYPYFRGIYCVFRSFLPPQTLRSFFFSPAYKDAAGGAKRLRPKKEILPRVSCNFIRFPFPFSFFPTHSHPNHNIYLPPVVFRHDQIQKIIWGKRMYLLIC